MERVNNIKSQYILQKIFNNLKLKKTLKLIKYNKVIQNKIDIKKEDYYNYSKIIIEIVPVKIVKTAVYNFIWRDGFNNPAFVNIYEGYESYIHIYFNDNNKEIKRNYFMDKDEINKIKIILDNEIKSFSYLFNNCYIEKITFKQFYREDITDMSYMFYECTSLKEINFNNFNTN